MKIVLVLSSGDIFIRDHQGNQLKVKFAATLNEQRAIAQALAHALVCTEEKPLNLPIIETIE